MTAALGLFERLGLPTPDAPSTASPPTPVLIWGASSAVGIYAVQLAKVRPIYFFASHPLLIYEPSFAVENRKQASTSWVSPAKAAPSPPLMVPTR